MRKLHQTLEHCTPCKSAYLSASIPSPYDFEEAYAFGIDTTRYQNLVSMTPNILLFASGNVLKAFKVAE